MPHREDPAKGPRPNQRAATHGYPFGFAKSQWLLRDRLLVGMRQRDARLGEAERTEAAASHEAVARALDWERLLGSFNHAGEDRFPVATIDAAASNLLAWLTHQGFHVVRNTPEREEPLPIVESRLPSVFDNARKIVVVVPEDDPSACVSHERPGKGPSTPHIEPPHDQGPMKMRFGIPWRLRSHREVGAKGER